MAHKIWFSSDIHLFHENIIKYCKRPFKDALEMNEALLTLHNERVKPQDLWYNLGDVCMWRRPNQEDEFIAEITKWNGHKRLFLGNHDHFPIETYIKAGFEKVLGTGRWFADSLVGHYPVHPMNIGSAKAIIHGHTHDQHIPDHTDQFTGFIKPYINLSVENIGYKPIELDDLVEVIKARTIQGAPSV